MYLWMLAAVVAYFIKGLCGFANTLVFTAILSFGSVNANISPIDLLLGYPANVILTWKNRKNLDPKVYIPLAVLVLAGSIPGAFLLKNVDARAIKLVFGVVVVALGAEMLSREYSKKRVPSSRLVLAIIGVAAADYRRWPAGYRRQILSDQNHLPAEYEKPWKLLWFFRGFRILRWGSGNFS